jgi:hypothetical protein
MIPGISAKRQGEKLEEKKKKEEVNSISEFTM